MNHVSRNETHGRSAVFAGVLLAATAIGAIFAPTLAADLIVDSYPLDEGEKLAGLEKVVESDDDPENGNGHENGHQDGPPTTPGGE